MDCPLVCGEVCGQPISLLLRTLQLSLELLEQLLWGWFWPRLLLGFYRLIIRSIFFYDWLFDTSSIGVGALHLGLPLVVGSEGALAEAALFLAIVSFAWPTRGGRQCWKTRFPAGIKR